MRHAFFETAPKWNRYDKGLDLERNAIHVFKLETDLLYKQVKLLYPEVLSESEQIKSDRYLQISDKKRYIVSRYGLRRILSDFTGLPASLVQFHLSGNKKPGVNGIEFNIAHSGNIVLIAVSNQPLGVDIEFINKDFDFGVLIPGMLTEKEEVFINERPDKLINSYGLWTRKEAVLKATGEGLTDELNRLDVLQPVVSRNAFSFSIKSFLINDGYVMSLAIENNNDRIYYWNYE